MLLRQPCTLMEEEEEEEEEEELLVSYLINFLCLS
jgi:hypothetical protein